MERGTLSTLPDFELPDHSGSPRRLSELIAGDPCVVQTFRGWWCPKEQRFFRRLVELQDEAEVAYSGIVSISVDPPAVNAAFRAGLGARWTFLSDVDREVQRRLGLLEAPDVINRPFLPRVFVVRPDLSVAAEYNGYWFWGRPSAEELRRDLREVSRAIRADWEPPRDVPGAAV